MDPWEWPAYVGIVWGLALFVVSLLPILVIQYRRYGDLDGRRLIGACGLSVYVVALFAYTLLPAPARSPQWCLDNGGGTDWQLVPFSTFYDAAEATRGLGLQARILSRSWLQIIFNVVLFVPLGIWCRRFFERGVLAATAIGLGVSILIETTQGTANWGLWPCSYRYASVDDVITNTFGALIGASVGWIVLFWMPQSSRLERARLNPRKVTIIRRWLGMVIDIVLVTVGTIATAMAARIAYIATGHQPPESATTAEVLVAYGVPLLFLVYVPALFGDGASLGQRIVWLTPSWPVPSVVRRLIRASVSAGSTIVLLAITGAAPLRIANIALLAAMGVVAISFLAVLFTPGRRGIANLIAGAGMVDSRVAPSDTSG